jgi:integrase
VPKRRPKGDGAISHRTDGRWQASFVVEVDGKKHRKYLYARTEKLVRDKLKDAIRDRDRGLLVLHTVTVDSWMTLWLDGQERKLKPQTMRSYREKARNYIVPQLGRHKLTSLRAQHVEAMYDKMRDDGRAEATVRQVHAILRRALKDAVRRDRLAVSPMEKVDPPGTEKNQRAQFTTDQARQVLAAAKDDARWWLALFYGMRQGECLGLDWGHVDLTRHTLTIAQTLQTNEDGTLFLGKPKSRASTRTLPLHPLIEARLRLHWERAGRPDTGLVFHRNGKPIQPKADWNAWRELIDAATQPPFVPLPYIALHAARNSAASLMESVGVQDRLVMQILGQSQVSTTHGYQTADLERIRQAFEAMGHVLELD